MSTMDDELALEKLMARYIDAANRRDGEAWSQTWAEDGSWNLMGMEVNGRDNIRDLWQQVMAGFEFAILLPSSHLFHVDGDVAQGHWYLQEFTRDLKGERFAAMSRYQDDYVKVDGQWAFRSRRYEFLYRGPADLSGDFTPLPNEA